MDFLKPTVDILCYGTDSSPREVRAVLEDAESPKTRKTMATLYQSIIDKSHVDFGDIPKSRGNITKYSGYKTMIDTLAAIKELSTEDKAYEDLASYANTVTKAIGNIATNATYYEKAYSKKVQVLVLEYNSFVYACVEATTALLFQIGDFVKTPSSQKLSVNLKNTKYRADEFFLQQLKEFNKVVASGKYQTYLSTTLKSGQENMVLDAFAVGSIAIVGTVVFTIVPVTRRIIYAIQDLRGRLARDLELQAYFLELNKSNVQAREKVVGKEKTESILKKQEALRLKFLRLAEKLRVESVKAEEIGNRTVSEEDRTMTMDSMRDSVNDTDIGLV
jgi:hypothetical protein